MSLVDGRRLVEIGADRQLSVPALDVAGGNVDMLHAICRSLSERDMVAFLASTPSSIEAYHGMEHFVDSIRTVAEEHEVTVAAHLDHATDLSDIERGVYAGCTSVMYDGSSRSLSDNIRRTRAAIEIARPHGVSVEGELGVIGGKEDGIVHETSRFPSIADAHTFVDETGVDLFAPAVGTAHGFYSGEPDLQWDLARTLREELDVPLVLHGGSGLEDDVLLALLGIGFSKVNIATAIRSGFLRGLGRGLEEADPTTKPQVVLEEGRAAVDGFLGSFLELLRSDETDETAAADGGMRCGAGS